MMIPDKFPIILSIDKVVTPGFRFFAISDKVLLTSNALCRIISTCSFVFKYHHTAQINHFKSILACKYGTSSLLFREGVEG